MICHDAFLYELIFETERLFLFLLRNAECGSVF